MSGFWNYVRGSEENIISNAQTNNQKLFTKVIESLRKNSTYFRLVLKFLIPKLASLATLLFLIILLNAVVLQLLIYRVGLLSGKFYKCLTNRDAATFTNVAFEAIAYIVFNASVKSINDYLTSLLSIVWRKYLTFKLHDLYFNRKQFYYIHYPQVLVANCKKQKEKIKKINQNIPLDNSHFEINLELNTSRLSQKPIAVNNRRNLRALNIQNHAEFNDEAVLSQNENLIPEFIRLDNPDQRITQDVNSLCKSLSTIIPLLLLTPFVICWYGYQVKFTTFFKKLSAFNLNEYK
jgi:ABC-type uncharacterized transport system fused permease/ATPase subunit